MKYPVIYSAEGWQQRARHPMLPGHDEECQIVRHELADGQRLYVELARRPGVPLRVLIARIEVLAMRGGHQHYRTVRFLQPDELDLIETPEAAPP